MANKTPAETYIGFAIRARKFKVGVNAVKTLKKAELLILCRSAAANTVKEAKKLAVKLKAPLIKTVKKDLEEITYIGNGKLMAVLDKELTKAILSAMGEEFVYYDTEA